MLQSVQRYEKSTPPRHDYFVEYAAMDQSAAGEAKHLALFWHRLVRCVCDFVFGDIGAAQTYCHRNCVGERGQQVSFSSLFMRETRNMLMKTDLFRDA